MKFFKTGESPRSAEDEAVLARLIAIANRCKLYDTVDFEPLPSAETPDEAAAGGRR